MRRVRIVLLTLAVAISSLVWSAVPAVAHPVQQDATYYLSLGDSLSVGVQPVASNYANTTTDDGYSDQLFKELLPSNPSLSLVKLGCPGETTASLQHPSSVTAGCVTGYQQLLDNDGLESQLDAALFFLNEHPRAVKYITINIGSNDVLPCVNGTVIDAKCTLDAIKSAKKNLANILGQLKSNVDGRGVKMAGMTYYDPYLAAWPSNRDLALQSLLFTNLLNAAESVTYPRYGFRVAPVAFAFGTNDFSVPPNSPVPTNVANICKWTWMCTVQNIHANCGGYKLIADTFARTFGVAPKPVECTTKS